MGLPEVLECVCCGLWREAGARQLTCSCALLPRCAGCRRCLAHCECPLGEGRVVRGLLPHGVLAVWHRCPGCGELVSVLVDEMVSACACGERFRAHLVIAVDDLGPPEVA